MAEIKIVKVTVSVSINIHLFNIEGILWNCSLMLLANTAGFCAVFIEVGFVLPIASSIPFWVIAESGWLHSAVWALVCAWCDILLPI